MSDEQQHSDEQRTDLDNASVSEKRFAAANSTGVDSTGVDASVDDASVKDASVKDASVKDSVASISSPPISNSARGATDDCQADRFVNLEQQFQANIEKANSETSRKYFRYRRILTFVEQLEEFLIAEVKQQFADEQPSFITRLIRDLAKEGRLLVDSDSQSYSWNRTLGKLHIDQWLDQRIFGDQITASPTEERPRERLLAQGADGLGTSELIAILVRSGRPGESAVSAGKKIAQQFEGRLQDLPAAGRAQLKSISIAVEKTAYCQIMAGIELGRRVAALADDPITTKITGSGDAIAFCEKHFARLTTDAKQEEFHIVTLDTKHQVIDTHQITVGTLDASLVHPREVFRAAIRDAASSVILVHNHPSGDPTPSPQDFAVTRRLEESGKLLGIDVLDHIVVARQSSVSIRECR